MFQGSQRFPNCHTQDFLLPRIKNWNSFTIFCPNRTTTETQQLGETTPADFTHSQGPLIWMFCRILLSGRMAGETNLDCGDCNDSCTVIRTQGHDLWVLQRDRKRLTPSVRTSVWGNCNRQGVSKLQVEVNVSLAVLCTWTKTSWCPSQALIWTKLWGYS